MQFLTYLNLLWFFMNIGGLYKIQMIKNSHRVVEEKPFEVEILKNTILFTYLIMLVEISKLSSSLLQYPIALRD